jgi:hypothetical protein
MLPATKTVSILLLLAITLVAAGQTVDAEDSNRGENRINGDDLPNGTVFYMTLLEFDHSSTRFGPADPAEWVAQELGLNNVDSHAFVSQALTTLYFINTDVKAQSGRIACEFSEPGVDMKDQFNALRQISDARKAINDHHFDKTKASLDAETGKRFQRWMDERKLNTTTVETDPEKAYQMLGCDPAVTLSWICGAAN